jgi:putative transposase
MLALVPSAAISASEIPLVQRRAAPAGLAAFMARHEGRDDALHAAYRQGGMTMTQLARDSGLSVSRVSRIIARIERGEGELATGKT